MEKQETKGTAKLDMRFLNRQDTTKAVCQRTEDSMAFKYTETHVVHIRAISELEEVLRTRMNKNKTKYKTLVMISPVLGCLLVSRITQSVDGLHQILFSSCAVAKTLLIRIWTLNCNMMCGHCVICGPISLRNYCFHLCIDKIEVTVPCDLCHIVLSCFGFDT